MILLRLLVDPASLPLVLVKVLRPLEVRHDHAAGVHQDVRKNVDAPVVEDLIGLGCQRMIGRFDDNGGPDAGCVVTVYHAVDRGRDQEIAV